MICFVRENDDLQNMGWHMEQAAAICKSALAFSSQLIKNMNEEEEADIFTSDTFYFGKKQLLYMVAAI